MASLEIRLHKLEQSRPPGSARPPGLSSDDLLSMIVSRLAALPLKFSDAEFVTAMYPIANWITPDEAKHLLDLMELAQAPLLDPPLQACTRTTATPGTPQ